MDMPGMDCLIKFKEPPWTSIALTNKFFLGEMLVCVGTYERILYGWEVTLPSPGNVSETKVAFALPVHQGYVKSIATAGRHLVTGGTDEVVKVFDLRKRREQGTLTHHSGPSLRLPFTPPPTC